MDVKLSASTLKTWAYWRPRVARLMLFGGLAWTALQFAPALPKEQTVEFRAAEGSRITELELSWRPPDGAVSGRTTLRPAEPVERLRHNLNVPNGTYEIEVRARLEGPCPGARTEGAPGTPHAPCPTQVFDQSRKVHMEEHTLRFDLTP
jgi:hypothetical protein